MLRYAVIYLDADGEYTEDLYRRREDADEAALIVQADPELEFFNVERIYD